MKINAKRFLALFLAAMMLFCLVACDDTENGDTGSEGATSGAGNTSGNVPGGNTPGSGEDDESMYLDENGNYFPVVGVLDEFKGETFTILVVGESGGTYQSDDFTTVAGSGGINYGDAYYGAVQARNDKIEEMYGVTLDVRKEDGAQGKAEQDAIGGTQEYDAILLPVSSMIALAQDNLLWDLRSSEFDGYFDESAPWWAESATEAYSIGNKLFFVTGDITIMNKCNIWSILFNKQMIVDHNLDDPYQLFEDGTWTFDKMVEMAKAVNTATSTSDWQDTSVTYGMITTHNDMYQFFGGSGLRVCEKNPEDIPVLTFGDEASVTIAEKVLTTMNASNWTLYAENSSGGPKGNIWEDSFDVFNTGRALFRPSGFTAVTKARSRAEMAFGILPMPKMTDTQEGYYTVTSGSWAAGILKNCRDHQFSAYMLDAYGAGAKNYVTPAYVEVNLLGKSLRDDESEEILYYIFDHIVYDVGAAYNFGGITSMFGEQSKAGTADIASAFGKIETQINDAIDDMVDAYSQDE